MSNDRTKAPQERDDGLGCQAFGHLTSPYVDGEVPRDELSPFETHLPSCAPCRILVEDYRSLDQLAMSDIPVPRASDWERTWDGVQSTIAEDAEAAESAPLAGILRFTKKLTPSRAVRPLLYLAASLLLAVGLSSLQDGSEVPAPSPGRESSRPAAVQTVACQAPGYVPMHYTIPAEMDAESITIIQCAWVGVDA